jgi:hypothetical protein
VTQRPKITYQDLGSFSEGGLRHLRISAIRPVNEITNAAIAPIVAGVKALDSMQTSLRGYDFGSLRTIDFTKSEFPSTALATLVTVPIPVFTSSRAALCVSPADRCVISLQRCSNCCRSCGLNSTSKNCRHSSGVRSELRTSANLSRVFSSVFSPNSCIHVLVRGAYGVNSADFPI